MIEMREFMAKVYPNRQFTDAGLGRAIKTFDLDEDGKLSVNELAIGNSVRQKK